MFNSICSDLGLTNNGKINLPEVLIIKELKEKYINNNNCDEWLLYNAYVDKSFAEIEKQFPFMKIING